MDLHDIMKTSGVDLRCRIKLVRHQDPRYDIPMLFREGFLDFYQSSQGKAVFDNCDYILSFIGIEATKALFVGMYRVNGRLPDDEVVEPTGYPYPEAEPGGGMYYDLQREPFLEDLKGRLVIEWGKSTRSWCQWLREDLVKPVVEIYPAGYVLDFPGYDEIVLPFHQLEEIVRHPDAN